MTAVEATQRLVDARAAVRAAVGAESVPPRLTEAVYLKTQKIYEAHSDQRVRIAQWIGESLPPVERPDPRVRVLSVGCGDGILDVAVAAALNRPDRVVHYLGVEPSESAGELFLQRLGAMHHVVPDLIGARIEDAGPIGEFDLIVAIHSLYYVDDLPTHLLNLRAALRPGGALVIMNAPLLGLNSLVEAVAPQIDGATSLAYSGEIGRILDESGIPSRRSRIDATLDISPCRDPGSEIGLDIMQFLAHADLGARSPGFRRSLVDYLDAIAFHPGGAFVPHPVDVFVVTGSA
jgi:SAM-dependent methyltransferase